MPTDIIKLTANLKPTDTNPNLVFTPVKGLTYVHQQIPFICTMNSTVNDMSILGFPMIARAVFKYVIYNINEMGLSLYSKADDQKQAATRSLVSITFGKQEVQ